MENAAITVCAEPSQIGYFNGTKWGRQGTCNVVSQKYKLLEYKTAHPHTLSLCSASIMSYDK